MNAEQIKPESDFTPASYKISVDGTIYSFDNPEPTAREILEVIGKDPTIYVLVFIAPDGEKRLLALDEETDLRQPGIEKFTFATTLRKFKVYVDETQIEFDKFDPTGLEILQSVGKKPCRYGVTQIIRDVDDQQISPNEKADLRKAGIERFTTFLKDDVAVSVEHEFVQGSSEKRTFEVQAGRISVIALKEKFGVPTTYDLYDSTNGPPTPLDNQVTIVIQGCEDFVTQVSSGASS